MSKSKGLKAEAVNSTFWASTSMVLGFVLRIIVMVVLARILTPEDYGIAAVAFIIIAFSQQFSEMGFAAALIQRHDINGRHIATTYTVTLFLGLVFCLLILLLSNPLAIFFKSTELNGICRAYSIVFLVRAFSAPSMAIIQRQLDFKSIFWIDTTSNIIGHVVISIMLALMGYGYWSLVIGNIAQIVVQALMSTYKVKSEVKFSFDKKSFKDLWGFSVAQTVTRFASLLASQGDKFIVSKFIGINALGFYGRACRMMDLPSNLFSKAFGRVLFPLLSRAQKKTDKVTTAYLAIIAVVMFIAIPASVHLSIYSDLIIYLFLGDQWGEVIRPFEILALAIYCKLGFLVSSITAQSVGGVRYLAVTKIMYGLSVLVLSYLSYEWGIVGVATAISISMVLHYLAVSILVIILLRMTTREIVNMAVLHVFLFTISYGCAFLVRFYMGLYDIGYAAQLIGFCFSFVISMLLSFFLLRRKFISTKALIMITEFKCLVKTKLPCL